MTRTRVFHPGYRVHTYELRTGAVRVEYWREESAARTRFSELVDGIVTRGDAITVTLSRLDERGHEECVRTYQ
jgi:hypothetical protein